MNGNAWRQVAISAMVAAVLALAAAGLVVYRDRTTTVLIVRHAEKEAWPERDPPLSPAGRQRAQELARVASHAGVSVIFATEFVRTQQTVQPLAVQLGVRLILTDAADVNGLVSEILSRRGSTILVAGHSNTVPQIVEGLGGGTVAPIADNEFDHLFVVFIPRWGSTRVVALQYGDRSGVAPVLAGQ